MKSVFYLFFFFIPLIHSAQYEAVKLSGFAQGSTYHITYFDSQNRNFQTEIEEILAGFDRSLSTYLPASTISRINSNDPGVLADAYFIICFKKAKEVWEQTDGAFDPTVYPLVNAWGFGPEKKQKINKLKIDSLLSFVGFQMISLNGNRIEKIDPRISLDFNAFAQGYSVDVVAGFLNAKGIASYLVEIGGEVYAKGKKPNGEFWKVGIEKPLENPDSLNPISAVVALENMALSTSGNYRRFFIENGVRYAHHIDPKTGYPAKNNLLSVSVFAKDCISSDAYATGILVLGLEKGIKFLELHKELRAYMIYSDEKGNYRIYQSQGLETIISDTE